MNGRGDNEGFTILEEFVCEAIPSPAFAQLAVAQGGCNEGASAVDEKTGASDDVARGAKMKNGESGQADQL